MKRCKEGMVIPLINWSGFGRKDNLKVKKKKHANDEIKLIKSVVKMKSNRKYITGLTTVTQQVTE